MKLNNTMIFFKSRLLDLLKTLLKVMKPITIGFAIICLIIAIPITALYGKKVYHDIIYRPQLNPHPKYFMTVKITGNEAIIKKLQPRIVTQYDTSNKKCQVYASIYEGIKTQRFRNDTQMISSKIINSKQPPPYFIKVPLDKYKPGVCNWQVVATGYWMENRAPIKGGDSIDGIFAFYDHKANPNVKKNAWMLWHCDNNLICRQIRGKSFEGQDNTIPFGNYTYTMKVKASGKRYAEN